MKSLNTDKTINKLDKLVSSEESIALEAADNPSITSEDIDKYINDFCEIRDCGMRNEVIYSFDTNNHYWAAVVSRLLKHPNATIESVLKLMNCLFLSPKDEIIQLSYNKFYEIVLANVKQF